MSTTTRTRDRETVAGRPTDPDAPLLAVEDLTVEFRTDKGVVRAVNGLSYELQAGETLAILGESGSGKSVSAQAVMGIVDSPPGFVTAGSVRLKGVNLFDLKEKERRRVRGSQMSLIFQDALTALNPVYTVGWQISEMLRVRGISKSDAKEKAVEILTQVGIPSAGDRFDNYPHEFSGGMRQRAMIAMSLALDPDVVIADEPTTALDVTVQAQVMELLAELQDEFQMGMILITHDLGVVADVADRVVVMYAGKEVEQADIFSLYERPYHPYTEGLMHSIPRADQKGTRLQPIIGQPPDLSAIPPGCSFNPRCPYAQDICLEEPPPFREVAPNRYSACHFAEELFIRD
ncbi:MAG: ATP-binding cassette domain-containing protein [Acidimicrobiia bacterium]|nr:ATP-binding cassette domain-containing protein [Acidimicrobiia bacterium]